MFWRPPWNPYRANIETNQRLKFTVVSAITNIQLIAKGNGIEIRYYLNQTYANGRRVHWRKLKGIAIVEYANGEIWEVELHWFESRGLGRKDEKDKRKLRRIA